MDATFILRRITEIEAEQEKDFAAFQYEWKKALAADRVYLQRGYDAARMSRERMIAQFREEMQSA